MKKFERLWSTFFTELGINFTRVNDFFWFPHADKNLAEQGWGTWVEVTPKVLTRQDIESMSEFVEVTGHNAISFQGHPWANGYHATKWAIIDRSKEKPIVKVTIKKGQFRTNPFNLTTQLVNERSIATNGSPGFSLDEAQAANEVATSSPVVTNANLDKAYKAAWELEVA